jgi:hypothetical protein
MRPTPGHPRRDAAYVPRRRRAQGSSVLGELPRLNWGLTSLNDGEPIARAAAGGACDDGTHVAVGPRWKKFAYGWRWNASSFGKNYDTRDSLRRAQETWGITRTDCDYSDTTDLTPDYKGSTDHKAGKHDGVNTADKGDMKAVNCDGAVACNIQWRTDNDTYDEADTRFNKDLKWSNSGKDGAYDYRSVATHEFGHMLGLADLTDSPGLTMYYRASTTSTKARTLGRGDIRGLRALYP